MKKFYSLACVALALTCSFSVYAADAATWRFVSAGSEQTYAIKTDGTLWAWGSAEYGELGNGSKTPAKISVPTQIGTDTDWKFVAGGSGRAFFIKENGTLWSTGTAEGGVLGTNSAAAQTVPVQIGTDTDWATVATSNAGTNYDALAIKTNGTLWGWGKNHLGCLGIGDYQTRAIPCQVGTDTDWAAVSIGRSHSLALKTDGTLWGCGEAVCGAIGQYSGYQSSWVKISDATDWKTIFAIDQSSYALKTDGTLWAWGENYKDILLGKAVGDDVASYNEPEQVTSINGKVLDMSGSQYNRVVIVDEDNATKAYAWGYNYLGAVGNGTGVERTDENPTVYTSPQKVLFAEEHTFISISSGQNFSAVLTADGKIYGWGSNAWGQLGTSEPENMLGIFKTTPIEMAASSESNEEGAEFDAQSIPASLNGIEKIVLTGEWGTADLAKLIAPLGNGQGVMGFNYNTALKTVDMSNATFAENTSFEKVFRNCSELVTVTFPNNETIENITSLNNAFLNDTKLEFIDVTGLVNVSDLTQAFQRCKAITALDLSKWAGVNASELAFESCENLATIALPGKFTLDDRCFASCTGLRLIDWSTFEGTTAPVIEKSSKYEPFYNLDFLPGDQAKITIIVPEAAYASFTADAYWKGFTIEKAAAPGSYTVNADEIPESLTDATHLTLTGVWDTAKFSALAKALGTGTNTATNSTLLSIDMSVAEIAPATKLVMNVPGLFGSIEKGVFQGYTALETVIMPAAEQAANFTSFYQAFQACYALKSIDLSGCTGLTATNNAFYQCSALETVKFPAAIVIGREMFDRCNALKTIDWSLFEGSEAPTYSMNGIPTLGTDLTVIVPEVAYDSFTSSEYWKYFTIVKATTGIEEIDASGAEDVARPVYNFSGQYVTTLAPGDDVTTLPAGLYIIAGKKVLVK